MKSKTMQGWECPKCGSIYSLFVTECRLCRGSNIKTVTSGWTTSPVVEKDKEE